MRMTVKTLALTTALLTAMGGTLTLQAQENAAAERRGAAMMNDAEHTLSMRQRLQALDARLDKIVQTEDPAQRQQLLQDYRQQMQTLMQGDGGGSGMMTGDRQAMGGMMPMMQRMDAMMTRCEKMMQSMGSMPQSGAGAGARQDQG